MDERIRQLERGDPEEQLRAIQWRYRLGEQGTGTKVPVTICPICKQETVPALQFRKKGREPKPTYQATCRKGKSCRPFGLPQEEPWTSLVRGGPFKDQVEFRLRLDEALFNKDTKKCEAREARQAHKKLADLSKSMTNAQWIAHFILKQPLDEVLANYR